MFLTPMFKKFARLIGRLSVSRKLLLIYLLDLTAVIFITSILIEEKFIAIDFARKEVRGVDYMASVRDSLFLAIGESGTAAVIGFKSSIAHAESAYGEGMNTSAVVETLAGDLDRLTTQDEALQEQLLLQAGRRLLSHIGDQSNLILDPDLDSYYTMSLTVLRFPDLLGQLLDYMSQRREPGSPQHLVLRGRIEALLDNIEQDYRKAYAGNPTGTLSGQLEPTRAQLVDVLRRVLDADMRDQHVRETVRSSAIVATQAAWNAAAASLNELLGVRISFLFHRMWLHLGMAAALLAVILFLVFFVASQISLPLRRLAGVADQVQATNDYSLRAKWKSGDEIGQLVRGFNTMLERLDYERIVQQELAAQARAAAAQGELLEAIPIPLLVTTIPDHKVLHANGPAAAWVDTSREDPWGQSLDSSARARFFQRLADEGGANEFEVRWNGPRGTAWALLSASRLNYQGQDAVLTTFSPINAIKRLEARLQLWAKIFEATSEGILVMEAGGRIVLVNAAMGRATGYRADELVGRPPGFLRSPRTDDDAQRRIDQAVTEFGAWQGEYWLKKKNADESPQWLSVNTVRDEWGESSHTIALFTDISERMAQEEKIRHLAHHDTLTGLPNRLLFNERLSMALLQAERYGQRVALLFIDLDRFKNINDSLGHHVGDGLLQSVSKRLMDSVRVGDTVCRQGGDEFVVILNQVSGAQEVVHVVERRMIPLILQTHCVHDVALHISCSVGIAIYPDDGRDMETLMRNADAAMYAAKSGGRNNFKFFSEDMNRNALERMNTENSLQHALDRNEFEVHVQPIVDIASGAVVSVEALLRWRQPSMGLIPPTKFIPIAEESGFIVDIGRWVLEEACRLHMQWARKGLGRIPVAVNVSAVQFRRGGFAKSVAGILEATGMPPDCLQIELTESLMMTEGEHTIDEVNQLKAMGLVVSLDDFGTGYSSLSYLHRFPIDKLKIDRSFIHDMIEDPADFAVTRAIISLGQTLGLRVVAEGVEHVEELNTLRDAGCDEVQGYYFSRPLPGLEFEDWLVEFKAADSSLAVA